MHAPDPIRSAQLVVATGLVVIALATAGLAAHRLVGHETTDERWTGALVVVPSIIALTALRMGKRRVGLEAGNRAMATDGLVSIVGAVFAAIALAGLGASSLVHWWWFNPVGSIVIATGAAWLAVVSMQGRSVAAPAPASGAQGARL